MSILGENISAYLRSAFGEEFLNKYENYIDSQPNYYLRFNSDIDAEVLINALAGYGIVLRQQKNLPFAYKVETGIENIGKTLEFTLGYYYVQSLSSMIPPIILNPAETETVLDLCAAPGSKTTQISGMMNNSGTLYANEISFQRLRSLVHNLNKINSVNTGVLNFKGELLSKVYDNYFDKALVDAPCSALGIVQKKEEVAKWWDTKSVDRISNAQLRLLISAIKMTKIGGEIVYSTCTLTLQENEFIVQKALEKYPVELVDINLPVKSIDGITKIGETFLHPEIIKAQRIIPWEINSEGFFIAKFRKIGSTEKISNADMRIKPKNYLLLNSSDKKLEKYLAQINEWFGIPLEILHQYKYLFKGKDIYFINKNWRADFFDPFNRIGIKFGNVDSGDYAHLHTLSAQLLAKYIQRNFIQLDNSNQLRTYMMGGTIKDFDAERGQKVVRFKEYTLGAAIQTTDGLKSQFPRSLRTGEIIIPD